MYSDRHREAVIVLREGWLGVRLRFLRVLEVEDGRIVG